MAIQQLTPDAIKKTTKPMIIKAFAPWCSHCTTMKPIFEQLEKEFGQKYVFAEFDVDEDEDLTTQLDVESLPTFIFMKNKVEAGRIVGEISEEKLRKSMEKYLG